MFTSVPRFSCDWSACWTTYVRIFWMGPRSWGFARHSMEVKRTPSPPSVPHPPLGFLLQMYQTEVSGSSCFSSTFDRSVVANNSKYSREHCKQHALRRCVVHLRERECFSRLFCNSSATVTKKKPRKNRLSIEEETSMMSFIWLKFYRGRWFVWFRRRIRVTVESFCAI